MWNAGMAGSIPPERMERSRRPDVRCQRSEVKAEIGGQWSGQAGDRQSYILSAFFSREGRKGREEDLNRVCPWPRLAVCGGFGPWARTGHAGRPSSTGAGKTWTRYLPAGASKRPVP